MTLRAYQERSSLRGLTRTFGISRQTVTACFADIWETFSFSKVDEMHRVVLTRFLHNYNRSKTTS